MTPAEEFAARKVARINQGCRRDEPHHYFWVCKIREKREALRLTIEEVALAVGVSKQIMWRLENGYNTDLDKARAVARFFGSTVEELWPEKSHGEERRAA